jgi:hypothetical protein
MFCAISAILLTQCDDWNKPLIERIKKSTGEQTAGNIQELIITQLPWPNTFNTGETEPVHYDNPDWPAGSWEEMGLEVCAILTNGDWQKLTPDKYIITGFDSRTSAEKEIINIYAKDEPEKSAEFPVVILNNKSVYRSVSSYQETGGKIIPYPSEVPLGSGAPVSLHIYPDNGYALDVASLKIETVKGGNVAYKAEDGVYTFIMPDSDVTLSAGFINCEAKLESGGGVTYHIHLKDAIEAAQNAGAAGTITLLRTPVYIDEAIKIAGGSDITLISGKWKEQEIQRGGVPGNIFLGGMIEIESGANLTLDGASGSLEINGGDARLAIVDGTFTMKKGVTLKNSGDSGIELSDGGKFTMERGAVLQNNRAPDENDTSEALTLQSGAEFTMTGGLIEGTGRGIGVKNGAAFYMDGESKVNGGILLYEDAVITANDALALSGGAGADSVLAVIIPEKYAGNKQVINGNTGKNGLFGMNKHWRIDAQGKIHPKILGAGGDIVRCEGITDGGDFEEAHIFTQSGNSVLNLNTIPLSAAVTAVGGGGGGGGGGGTGVYSNMGGYGGGGGQKGIIANEDIQLNAMIYTVTVGAGGAGGAGGKADGNDSSGENGSKGSAGSQSKFENGVIASGGDGANGGLHGTLREGSLAGISGQAGVPGYVVDDTSYGGGGNGGKGGKAGDIDGEAGYAGSAGGAGVVIVRLQSPQ